jgi:hypothetical protein
MNLFAKFIFKIIYFSCRVFAIEFSYRRIKKLSLFYNTLPESWTRGLVKKSLNLTKRYDQTNPTQIHT